MALAMQGLAPPGGPQLRSLQVVARRNSGKIVNVVPGPLKYVELWPFGCLRCFRAIVLHTFLGLGSNKNSNNSSNSNNSCMNW